MRGLDKDEVEQLRLFVKAGPAGAREFGDGKVPTCFKDDHVWRTRNKLSARGLIVFDARVVERPDGGVHLIGEVAPLGRLALRIADMIADGRKILRQVGA